MKATYHAIVSALLAVGLLYAGAPTAALVCLLSGIFIDVDHALDYYILTGGVTFSATVLVDTLVAGEWFYCPFHAIECILLIPLIFGTTPIGIGLATGVTVHIVIDMFTNNIHPLNLSLIYRAVHKFKRREYVWM